MRMTFLVITNDKSPTNSQSLYKKEEKQPLFLPIPIHKRFFLFLTQKIEKKESRSMMKISAFPVLSLSVVLLLLSIEKGICRGDEFIRMKTLGGVHDCMGSQNSFEIEKIARFAVQEHNKKENGLLEFARVVKAKEQVVAGKMYHLTLEAIDAGKKQLYEAKVWVKPWVNFKQLQEFKHAP
ncbi:unnamed protein product [Ilex paraguariensis]|uniref:Cysteine proteinase inhibitor n=1 Tax=Ilex paraguariensis TaxID=185542 RepID=A0ABC8V5F6_9AQUA